MPRISVVLLAVLAYWALVVAFQYAEGAPSEPFGGYPDEPAHYMSGLMMRDYVAAGFPGRPFAFAANYYTHLPYEAIGYWPPLFYAVEGLWMLALGNDRTVALLLVALVAAAAAATCFRVLAPRIGLPGAFIFGLLLLITPAFQWSDCLIMSDTMLALLCLWFGLAFARWAREPSVPGALLAGILLAAALLTKINGIHLFAVIPLFFLITGRWPLLRKVSFWIIPTVVMIFWIPWIFSTRQFLAIGFGGLLRPPIPTMLKGVALSVFQNLEWLLLLVLAGLVYAWKRLRADYTLSICVLLPLCYAAFLLVAGVSIEYRFLTPILTPSIILAGVGLRGLARKFAPDRLSADRLVPILALVCVAGFAATVGLHWHASMNNTIRPVVDFLRKRDPSQQTSVLVPSSAEGPFIAQFAMGAWKRPDRLLVRPNKLLASETWNGAAYKLTYTSTFEIAALLDRFPLRYIILAASKANEEFAHDPLLKSTIENHPERWIRVNMPSTTWLLYERRDGRELPARAMEAMAREALGERLRSIAR
jgi:Dolichyl-phosphate-mannose-protein mannosyltransferase